MKWLLFCSRRKQIIENNNEKTFQSFNQSNSYIHYNSPRYSLRGGKKERKGSTASALTFSSNGSFRSLKVSKLREAAVDDLHDLHELDMNTPEDDAQYYLKMDEKVTESLQSNIQVPTSDQLTIFSMIWNRYFGECFLNNLKIFILYREQRSCNFAATFVVNSTLVLGALLDNECCQNILYLFWHWTD